MNFYEHQQMVLQLAKPLPHDQQVEHALIGCLTEMGEIADMIKRHVIYEKPLDKTNGMEEVGDLFWYLSLYCHEQRIAVLLLGDAVALVDFKSAHTDSSLMTFTILLGSMVGVLLTPREVRGVPDVEIVLQIARMLAVFCHRMGYTVEQALQLNFEKLAQKRFKSGAFTTGEALNRDTVGERVILEGTAGGAG